MKLDDYIEGTFDPLNPANWDEDLELFESDNISKCLDYLKEFDDYEPLENSIMNQQIVIENAISELQYCIYLSIKIPLLKNKLLAIQRKLELTQL